MKYSLIQHLYEQMPRLPVADKRFTDMTRDDYKAIAAFLREHAAPYLKEANGGVLYRGHGEDRIPIQIRQVRTDRKPVGTHQVNHQKMMQKIEHTNLIANRHNSAFVTGSESMASSYGIVYTFFPLGKFNFTWAPGMEDGIDWSSRPDSDHKQFPIYLVNLFKEWVVTGNVTGPKPFVGWVETFFAESAALAAMDKYTDQQQWEQHLAATFDTNNAAAGDARTYAKHTWFDKAYGDGQGYLVTDTAQRAQLFFDMLTCIVSPRYAAHGPDEEAWLRSIFPLTDQERTQIHDEWALRSSEFWDDYSPWTGDNDTLPEAIESGNEIMIHCNYYVLLSFEMWTMVKNYL